MHQTTVKNRELIDNIPESFWDDSYDYDPETGIFTRKKVPRKYFSDKKSFNNSNRITGKRYGFCPESKSPNTCMLTFHYKGHSFRITAARMAWFYAYRQWPKEFIHCVKKDAMCYRKENLQLGGVTRHLPSKKPPKKYNPSVKKNPRPEGLSPTELLVHNELARIKEEDDVPRRRNALKDRLRKQVVYDKDRKVWAVQLVRGHKRKLLGTYRTKELAQKFGERLVVRYKDTVLMS